MIRLSRFLSALMCAVFLCGATACSDEVPTLPDGGSIGNFSGRLNIFLFDGGYGEEWLNNIKAAYIKKNPRVKIDIKVHFDSQTQLSNLEAGTSQYDILFLTDNMFNLAKRQKLLDISEVYEFAEEGSKPLSERMDQNFVDNFRMDDGKFYLMPWADSREGLIYNKTVADKLFPDGMPLPRTTDEMFEIFDMIGDRAYPFVYSGTDDYLPYLFIPFWAQYEGMDAFNAYYEGYYYDEDGNRIFDKTGATVSGQTGRLRAWEVLEKLCKASNGYCHDDVESMDFMEAQLAFLGQGFGDDSKECVFSLNGEWLENEADFSLQDKAQEIRFARTPVMSSVKEKLDSIPNDRDDILRAVVDYADAVLDGVTPEKTALMQNVSDEDIQWVINARSMVNSVAPDHNVGINADTKVKNLAIDFLKFLTTEEAGRIYSRTLNGIKLPYGAFDPLTDETITIGEFQKSKQIAYKNNIPVYQLRKPILVYRGGFAAFREKWGAEMNKGTWTAQSLYDSNNTYNTKNWANMVKQAGLSDLL